MLILGTLYPLGTAFASTYTVLMVCVLISSAISVAASPPKQKESTEVGHKALCRDLIAEFCPPLLHLTRSEALEIRRAAVSTIKEVREMLLLADLMTFACPP